MLQSVVQCCVRLRYARYGSELAVGSCDDVTATERQRRFSHTARRNANFAHSAFQEVLRAFLQLSGNGRCFRGVTARPDGGQKGSATGDNGILQGQKRD